MRIRNVFGLMLAALAIVGISVQARAMNKAELVDAISASAKLTKADAGRALDATIAAVSKALKKGDKVSLVGFGTFALAPLGAQPGADGTCEEVLGSSFEAAPTFARRIFPVGWAQDFAMSVTKAAALAGQQAAQRVTGRILSGTVQVGDVVMQEEGFGHHLVTGITVGGVSVTEASAGIAVLNIENTDRVPIIRGTALRAPAYSAEQNPALSPCESYTLEPGLADAVSVEGKLTAAAAISAVAAFKTVIMDTLASGDSVQVGELGEFYVQGYAVTSTLEPGSELSKIPAGFVVKKTNGILYGKK